MGLKLVYYTIIRFELRKLFCVKELRESANLNNSE